MTEFHDVVKLLLTRMESHPEEFQKEPSDLPPNPAGHRWWRVMDTVTKYGAEEEKQAIKHGMRKIQLAKAHEMMMDELLNGDERRQKLQEDQEYEASLLQQMRQQQMTMAQQDIVSKYQDVARVSRYPTSTDMEYNGIFNAIRNIMK